MTSSLPPVAPAPSRPCVGEPAGDTTPPMPAMRASYALLDQFGVIDAVGADAADFLHKQLTNDVTHLGPDAASIGGLCSPKGRLIASFLYWRDAAPDSPGDERVRLVLAADIREAIQKRLSMFVLRAKVALRDVTPELALLGLSAPAEDAAALRASLAPYFDGLPEGSRERRSGATGTLVRLPDAAGRLRFLWALPRPALEAILSALRPGLTQASASYWDWLDVQSGEPRVTAATQDRFVPQMINFEAIGGVNFRKGCYPGQEVVARSQYRGTIKRRATLAHAPDARAGDEVFAAQEPGQPCGHVVNVAPAPDGGVDCLVELKLSLTGDAALHVGSATGPRLSVRGLPYALPDLSA